MVKIGIMIEAALKNVDKFYPHDPDTFSWTLKVKCTSCGEEDPNWHSISEGETVELSRAEAHFRYKCKCCSRENYLIIIPSNHVNGKDNKKGILDTVYKSEDEDKFKTIKSFDCRGLELTDFQFGGGWAVESGTQVFTDVDLTEKEWFDYNEVESTPVEITNIQYQFVTVR